MHTRWIVIGLGFALAAASLPWILWAPTGPGVVAGATRGAEHDEAILRELRAIRESLDALASAMQADARRPAVPTRSDAGDASDADAVPGELVDAVRQEVRALTDEVRQQLEQRGLGLAYEGGDALPPADPQALRQFFEAHRTPQGRHDSDAWLLASEAEVLRRFGRPSAVRTTEDGGQVWSYVQPDGEQRQFVLHRGRLIATYD